MGAGPRIVGPASFAAQGKTGVFDGNFTKGCGDFNIGEGAWVKFDIVTNDTLIQFRIHSTTKHAASTGDLTMKMQLISLVFASIVSAPAVAAPETFVVDGTHTYPRFSYSHFGYSTQMSRFNNTTGKVVLDKAGKTGSVEIVIDAKSVDTGSPIFNEHIQGTDFLDTVTYPRVTFNSTKVLFEGDKPVQVEGNLTIKGVTKPVTLTVTSFHAMPHPMVKRDAIGANAYTIIKRSEFNAGKYAPHVSDEVRIDVSIEAIKE